MRLIFASLYISIAKSIKMGRWDEKTPRYGLDLDIAGIVLLAIGCIVIIFGLGSNIIGYTPMKGVSLAIGVPLQIFFILSGFVSSFFGIILLFVNGGHIKLKPLKYEGFFGDDYWK
jgi:hypothetical protein